MPAITDPIAVLTEHLTGGDSNVAFIVSTTVMRTFSVSSGISSNYQPATFAAQNTLPPATNAEHFTQGQGRNRSTTADKVCRDGCCEDAI